MEHGPYQVMNEAPGIRKAPYSWNRAANMLYIEHPIGVGFSYSDTPADYKHCGDDREADDLFNALGAFLERYPEFSKSPLYLSGESYAGEYIPHLAFKILTDGTDELKQNFKGFAVGNPVFNCVGTTNGQSHTLQMNMFLSRGMLSWQSYDAYTSAGCSVTPWTSENSGHCGALFNDAQDSIGSVDQQLLAHADKQLLTGENKNVGSRAQHAQALAGAARRRKRGWRAALPAEQGGFANTAQDSARQDKPEGPSPQGGVGSARDSADSAGAVESAWDPDHKYQSFCIG
jgi:hypothetical protein